jgi:radical SAM protein with 4Fe4S-binding SPASM domain
MKKKRLENQPIAGAKYPGFEDLSSLNAVKIRSGFPLSDDRTRPDESILIHLTITGRCYARCKGCINSAVTMGSDEPRNSIITFHETEPERDAAIIEELAGRHPAQTITVCFYGGEPFLASGKMERTWRILKESDGAYRFRFMVYTNGELLSNALDLYPEFMKNMWLYSISIDGDEEQHNRIRQGTSLSKIKRNLKELSDYYSGYVLFWSTLREEQSLINCFEEFLRIYREGLVSHFFWHWAESRESFSDFQSYILKYGQELEKIMDVYVQKILEGKLLPVIHINELILFLITAKERGHTACGVELAKNYDIVSGKLYPCADLPSSLSIGEMGKNGRLKLREYELNSLVEYKKWLGCYRCGIHPYCGGRCPVQVIAGSRERTYQICQLMRLHVGIVQKRIFEILKGLKKNRISLQDIYDQSAFMAKYTDVVP